MCNIQHLTNYFGVHRREQYEESSTCSILVGRIRRRITHDFLPLCPEEDARLLGKANKGLTKIIDCDCD